MINVQELINKNRAEVFDFIKSQGGFINFASKNQDECLDDEWDGDIDEVKDELPWLAIGGDEYIANAAILAVKCGADEKNHMIDVLYYDIDSNDVTWTDTFSCVGYNEQVLYDHIGGLIKKMS